jgi:ribosome-associated heat shock protein Hsp15
MVTEACKKNHVTVNGQVAKPSREVLQQIKSPFVKIKLRKLLLLDVPDNRVAAKLVDIYRNDTPAEAYQHLELLKLSKEHYRKNGTGRPTKKERSMNLEMKS